MPRIGPANLRTLGSLSRGVCVSRRIGVAATGALQGGVFLAAVSFSG